MTEKAPVGRPRTTLKDIPEDWENIVIDSAQQGASDVELRCLLGLTQTSWSTLLEDSDEFCITIKRAHDLCQVWWERCGRSMASGQAQGNATTWIFNMKNRFGWNDKTQVDHRANDGSLSKLMDELTSVQPKSLSDFYDDESFPPITVKDMTDEELLAELQTYEVLNTYPKIRNACTD